MTGEIFGDPAGRTPVLANLGSGHAGSGRVPRHFEGWREVRVDLDPATAPDILTSLTDLSPLATASVDAVYASHCLEHLYRHEVTVALVEIARVLRADGFACIRVPDLQTIAGYITADRLHEVIYESPSGPVTAHDVVFGYGPDVAQGRVHMAHRTGFTPTLMMQSLQDAGFEGVLLRRTSALELVAVARRGGWSSPNEPGDLLDALGL